MATLTGQTIASSYEQLLHVDTDGGGNTTTLVPVKDGDNGTTFAMQLSTTTICIDNPTADSSTQGGILRLQSDDGALMQSGSRLGVIEFGGAEDSSNTITVGARIEAVTDALWAADENGADMVFYTTDGNAAQSEHLRIKSGSAVNLVITGGSTHSQVDFAGSDGTKDGSIYAEATNIGFLDDDGNWAVRAETDVQTSLYVNNSIKLLVDANSRISLGNNDISAVTSTTIFGYLAGQDIESGATHNTYFGSLAGSENTTGDNNTYIGANSGLGVNGNANNGNTGIGKNTLTAVTTGGSNVCVGVNAGDSITTANHSIFIGSSAGDSLTVTGGGNAYDGQIGIGTSALASLTTGQQNTAVGYQALDAEVDGDYSTAIGYAALTSQTGTDGSVHNTAVGANSLGGITTGTHNIGVGSNVLLTATTALRNVAIGFNAMTDTKAGIAVADCVAIGYDALKGHSSNTTTGVSGSVAIGKSALTALTSGAGNTAVGYTAGAEEVAGNDNTMIGYEALHDGGGLANLSNTVIGSGAGGGTWANTASSYNTIVGKAAMNDALDGALHNVAVGFVSGGAITEGQRNTFVGGGSGNSCTTGDKNTSIGNDSDVAAAVDNQIAIGYSTEVTAQYGIAIGDDITAGTNDAVMGKNGAIITVDFDADGTWAQSSDIRKKRNIKEDSLGLSFINDLKTKTFQWKPAEEHPDEWGHFKVDEDGNKVYVDVNTDVVMHGMIAQEVKESLDKAGCDTFGGWKVGDNGQQELSKASFVIPLIKAVQELTARVKELEDA